MAWHVESKFNPFRYCAFIAKEAVSRAVLSGLPAVEMVLMDNDGFLTALTRFFQQTKSSGSVYLTMKKCEYDNIL